MYALTGGVAPLIPSVDVNHLKRRTQLENEKVQLLLLVFLFYYFFRSLLSLIFLCFVFSKWSMCLQFTSNCLLSILGFP